MNKEQKSFGEYGAAWATTVVIHTYIRSLFLYPSLSEAIDRAKEILKKKIL